MYATKSPEYLPLRHIGLLFRQLATGVTFSSCLVPLYADINYLQTASLHDS